MHAWRKMKPRLGCLFVCLDEGVGGGKKGPLRHSQPELLSLIVVPSGGAEQAPDNLPPKKTESFSPYPPAPYQLKQRWRCEYLISSVQTHIQYEHEEGTSTELWNQAVNDTPETRKLVYEIMCVASEIRHLSEKLRK